MAFADALKDKILKLGSKQKLDAIIKYAGHSSEDIRITVAIALGMIPTYDSGMALIPLLRDQSPMVRASACESAAAIHAKVCEEYVKKLAFTETCRICHNMPYSTCGRVLDVHGRTVPQKSICQ